MENSEEKEEKSPLISNQSIRKISKKRAVIIMTDIIGIFIIIALSGNNEKAPILSKKAKSGIKIPDRVSNLKPEDL